MFTIGDFARLGRVSVRMLRHYDAIGLLCPARVDAGTGYRYYEAAQLARLNRVIALKDLGFTLQQVQSILDEKLDVAQLHGMLRLRRAELAAGVQADLARLANVEVRLSMIEKEGLMPTNDVVVKHVPAVRVAELSAVAADFESPAITPVIRPLYDRLVGRLAAGGVTAVGAPIAYYEEVPDGVLVHAAMPVPPGAAPPDVSVVDLPAADVAVVVHRGAMAGVDAGWQELATWVEAHGYRTAGQSREVYLECPGDENRWVTELQEALAIEVAG
jgi:DNA-binding transcriptional MerR regulator/predicted transcriptional regulator YdeE